MVTYKSIQVQHITIKSCDWAEPVETRICKFCSLNTMEDEKLFLLNCELYVNQQNVYRNLTLQSEFSESSV